jgi:hypothetical protein
MARREYLCAVGVAQTSGAAAASIAETSDIPDGAGISLSISCVGRETTTGEVARYKGEQGAKRVSGTASLVGNLLAVLTMANGSDAALALCSVAVVQGSNANRYAVQCTGVANKTIEWQVRLDWEVN